MTKWIGAFLILLLSQMTLASPLPQGLTGIVGGLTSSLGGDTDGSGGLVDGLPVVGGLLDGGPAGLVDGLPLVGGLVDGGSGGLLEGDPGGLLSGAPGGALGGILGRNVGKLSPDGANFNLPRATDLDSTQLGSDRNDAREMTVRCVRSVIWARLLILLSL